jgi:hypothetical protein
MPFENKPNTGALFKNRDKGNNEKAPNLKGTALLQLADGSTVELDIAGWARESEKAGRWLSLSVKLKGDQLIRQRFDNDGGGHERFNQRVQEIGEPIDEEIPF